MELSITSELAAALVTELAVAIALTGFVTVLGYLGEKAMGAGLLGLGAMVASLLCIGGTWLGYAWHVFGVPLEEYPYRPEVVQLCQYWYRHPLAYLDALPAAAIGEFYVSPTRYGQMMQQMMRTLGGYWMREAPARSAAA